MRKRTRDGGVSPGCEEEDTGGREGGSPGCGEEDARGGGGVTWL